MGRKTETLICCSTYLCIVWLLLACAVLTADQTRDLCVSVQRSNQLNYPARAPFHSSLKNKKQLPCYIE